MSCKPVRQSWYACACCPPNIARLICSIGSYAYTQEGADLYAQLYLGSTIIILDEPTSVLTPDEADEVLGFLHQMTRGLIAWAEPGSAGRSHSAVSASAVKVGESAKHFHRSQGGPFA